MHTCVPVRPLPVAAPHPSRVAAGTDGNTQEPRGPVGAIALRLAHGGAITCGERPHPEVTPAAWAENRRSDQPDPRDPAGDRHLSRRSPPATSVKSPPSVRAQSAGSSRKATSDTLIGSRFCAGPRRERPVECDPGGLLEAGMSLLRPVDTQADPRRRERHEADHFARLPAPDRTCEPATSRRSAGIGVSMICGADLEKPIDIGFTPMAIASLRGHEGVVRFLTGSRAGSVEPLAGKPAGQRRLPPA